MQTFVSLKTSIDDEDVICAVQGGDILLVRHPMKMYISFMSEDINAKFFINAYYSQSLTDDAYVNHSVCSDGGASLGDVHSQSSSNSSSSSGGGVLENIKIVVAPRDYRRNLMISTQANPLHTESFIEEIVEVKEDDTFKYLLLTVGGLLVVVSILMLANTYVTRKHLGQTHDDH